MPLQMQATGGGSNGGVIDLYSPYMQQQQYAQQQRQADWQAVMNAFQQFARMKAENDFLKSQGIVGQKPVTKTAEVGSPEWNRFAQEQMQKGIVVTPESGKINYPTGKTQSFFDQSKIPPGMKITIPGTGFEVVGQQPGITTIPEGFEVAGYNTEGLGYLRKIKEDKETYTEQKRADLMAAVGRIKNKESNFEEEKDILLSKYPDISYDTLLNLKDIAKTPKEQGSPASKYKAGDKRVVNGTTYIRNAQGQWLP